MATAAIFNLNNEKTGEIELNDAVFQAPINRHLMWEAVNHYLASRREGSACTKTRGEVAGSRRKLWKQKGTGRARVGDIRTPKWRGGGTVHGPKPRSFDYAFPKKKRRGALRCALSDKLANGRLKVVDSWKLESHRTKELVSVLNRLEGAGRTLLVDDLESLNLMLASRNLPAVKFSSALGLNIHDLLKYDQLIISTAAVQKLQEVLAQ
jgi:large subunit ribosomal protein L4